MTVWLDEDLSRAEDDLCLKVELTKNFDKCGSFENVRIIKPNMDQTKFFIECVG